MSEKEQQLNEEEILNSEESADTDELKEENDISDFKKEAQPEENDNWKFDAKAPTLENNISLGNGFELEIADVPAPEKPEIKSVNKKENIIINKKALKIGFVSAFSAILAALLIFFGVRFFAFPNTNEIMSPGNVALTAGKTKISVGMYNFHYNLIVNNFKQYAAQGYIDLNFSKDFNEQFTTDENDNKISWLEAFKRDTFKQFQYIAAYYEPAIEAGITLTDEQKESIDTQIESIKSAASEAGMSLNKYLKKNYGDYCGEKTLRKYCEYNYICQNYFDQMSIKMALPIDEVKQYYDEHKDDYVSFAYIEMPFKLDGSDSSLKTIDDVKAKAQSYCDKIDSVKDMKDLVPELCADLIKQAVEQGYFKDKETALKTLRDSVTATYKADIISKNFGEEILEWFRSSDRANGDTTYYINEDDGYVFIFLKTDEVKPDDTELYSVRHILISPTENPSDAKSATEEQWNTAKEQAEKIIGEYNNGEKTELSFALLAENYSADTSSLSKGQSGNYGGSIKKTKLGVMVPEFEAWATDKSRQYGDVDIVKSDYGYHIMYFIYDGPTYLFNAMDDANDKKTNDYINAVECKERSGFKRTDVAEPSSEN